MNSKIVILFLFFTFAIISSNIWAFNPKQKDKNKDQNKEKTATVKETKGKDKAVSNIKIDSSKVKSIAEIPQVADTTKTDKPLRFKLYKKDSHASYYASRFEGRRTASGKSFSNTKYTAAHKKLPFGTKVKVTNEANGKSVVVEITDRGPFSKVREIDLSKKAFMELVDNKNSGSVKVKIEVEDK